MPNCRVSRTHLHGRPLNPAEWTCVPGPVTMYTLYRESQKRWVNCLRIVRQKAGGASDASPYPDLCDVELLAFSTHQAMMVAGFEEIVGARYYQGWYIVWE